MMRELELDDKAAKMLAIYEKQKFDTIRTSKMLHLQLVLWVIRTKLAHSLKRVMDMAIALGALFIFSPVMVGTAVLVKLSSPGPIFFKQVRVGKWGSSFYCYKFRSMYMDAEERKEALIAQNEADGPVFKMKNDPRITPIGKYIRKLSIDELPQLFNVLKGEMSLVGPRPPVPREVSEYEFDQLGRLNAVPGITGLQQVSGRSSLDFQTWVELDLQYIAEQSFWKDIEILLKTIPAVVFSRGAY
ncbi:MAG: sugar transferase [Anaerolineales bacterium]|nr:sugar transferase [Anaerolineales bacterium]